MRNDFDFAEPEGPGLDLARIFQLVRRRRWQVIVASAIALIPALAVPFMLPAVYQSMARLALQARPEVMQIGLDLLEPTPGRTRDRVDSMASLVHSSAVLGRIVDQMGPLEAGDTGWLDWFRGDASTLSADQVRARRIQGLAGSLVVADAGGGTVLTISSEGEDPVQITFFVNAVADALVDYHRERNHEASRKALAWLNEQNLEVRSRIDRRQDAIAALLEESGLSPSEEAPDRRSLAADIAGVELELRGQGQRLAELRATLRRSTQHAPAQEEDARIREQHREAVAALEAARLQYTGTHPQVRRLETIVASLSAQLGSARGSSRYTSNSAVDAREIRDLEAQRAGLRARLSGLREQLSTLETTTEVDSEAQARYDRLSREQTLDEQMHEVLLKRRNEALLSAATEHPGVLILDYAVPATEPSSPNRPMLLLFGIISALGFGAAVGLALEWLDARIREPEDVARTLAVPTLALVPSTEDWGTQAERQCALEPGTPAAEAYRNLRTALQFSMTRQKVSSLLVTSAIAGEGKTTVSCNLAASFALMGRKVLLVDGDMRRARVHRVFDVVRTPGLSEILAGMVRFEDCVQRPEGVEFDVLPSGALPDNPSELIASPKRDLVFARIKNQYDIVIIDSPVLLAVSDALVMASDADATILVHRLGSVDKRALTRMHDDLKRAEANVLGVVFNHVDSGDPYLYPAYMESPYVDGGRKKRPGNTAVDRAGS